MSSLIEYFIYFQNQPLLRGSFVFHYTAAHVNLTLGCKLRIHAHFLDFKAQASLPYIEKI